MNFKKHYKLYLLSTCVGVFAGCTPFPSNQNGNSLSDINHTRVASFGPNSIKFQKINSSEEQKKLTKVVYVPVPMPGQLMNSKSTSGNSTQAIKMPEFRTKQEAVDYANKNAVKEPSSNGYFNSIMTYQYTPGSFYKIYTSPNAVTDIQLEAGEKLVSEAAGDTLNWQVSQTYSGDKNGNKIEHLLVKPQKPDINTNMLITTNKRVYTISLQSTKNGTYMAQTKWNYPEDMVQYSNPNISSDSGNDNNLNIDMKNANFNYKAGVVDHG